MTNPCFATAIILTREDYQRAEKALESAKYIMDKIDNK